MNTFSISLKSQTEECYGKLVNNMQLKIPFNTTHTAIHLSTESILKALVYVATNPKPPIHYQKLWYISAGRHLICLKPNRYTSCREVLLTGGPLINIITVNNLFKILTVGSRYTLLYKSDLLSQINHTNSQHTTTTGRPKKRTRVNNLPWQKT